MYSFEELESKCRKYRLKKIIIPTIFVTAFFVGGMYSWQYMYSVNKETNTTKYPFSSISLPSKKQSKTVSKIDAKKRCLGLQLMYVHEQYKQNLQIKKRELKKLGLSCHINFGKILPNKQRQLFLVCETRRRKKELLPIINFLRKHHIDYSIVFDDCKYLSKTPLKLKAATTPKKVVIKSKASITDNIIESKPMTLQQLQQLFQDRQSYDLAMKIALEYYRQKLYQKAMKWAKIANKLNRQKEDAWILYAKTLYKLGKRERAKQLLTVFLDYKDSHIAKELLKKWK